MEYTHEGELLDIICESGNLFGRNAKQVLQDILQTVKYLHEKGIVHRDTKLEIILCANGTWPLQIKLADFGLSRIFDSEREGNDHVMRTHCGTQYYIAPEVANRPKYSESVDLWACGVVLYLMIAGKFTFYGDSNEALILRLRRGLKFPENDWSDISDDAKSLVRGLLDPNPASRLTVDEALKLRWFINDTDVVEGNGIRTQVISNDQQEKGCENIFCPVTLGRNGGMVLVSANNLMPMLTYPSINRDPMKWKEYRGRGVEYKHISVQLSGYVGTKEMPNCGFCEGDTTISQHHAPPVCNLFPALSDSFTPGCPITPPLFS